LYRPLILAALLLPASAHAQSMQPAPRPMPTYQDSDAQWRGGTSETTSTTDMHHHVDQTPPPPPVPEGYGYDPYRVPGSGPDLPPADDSRTSKPRQGNPDDAAHRADRAQTAELNRRPWRGYNAAPTTNPSNGYAADHARYRAQLAAHAQDVQRYRADEAQYEQRLANWRQQTEACARDAYSCGGGD
jgi:hypothetical protein